mgnify:CR=1 FL=1
MFGRVQRPEPDAIEVIIGPRATFNGHLRCDTSIRIDGSVEGGHIETPANVILTETARAQCDITAKTVSIRGLYKGVLRADFQPALHARQYETAGAACLSVLTDAPYFQGKDDDLVAARNACAIPCLRKDFMIDPWQVEEARYLGADCILIIMAAVSDTLAQDLYDIARGHGMDVLIETHDQAEMDRAVALNAGDAILGINNRNLKTCLLYTSDAADE